MAEALCRWLGRDWRVEAQPEPPAPDVVIGQGVHRAHVELVGYRATTQDNERYENDARFCAELKALTNRNRELARGTWHLRYARDSRGVARVPKPGDVDTVYRDLSRLVRSIQGESATARALRVRVHLGRQYPERFDLSRDPRVFIELGSSSFPLLEEWFVEVEYVPHEFDLVSCAGAITDLHSGFVGLSEPDLSRIVRGKGRKAMSYQVEPGSQLWLAIHADGYPLSTCLPEHLEQDACELIRESLCGDTHPFDRVLLARDVIYWASGTSDEEARAQFVEVYRRRA